jgi:hypothetical protein
MKRGSLMRAHLNTNTELVFSFQNKIKSYFESQRRKTFVTISCMTTDNVCFYLQTGLIQTSQTGGQRYSDTIPTSTVRVKMARKKVKKVGACWRIKFKSMEDKFYFI